VCFADFAQLACPVGHWAMLATDMRMVCNGPEIELQVDWQIIAIRRQEGSLFGPPLLHLNLLGA